MATTHRTFGLASRWFAAALGVAATGIAQGQMYLEFYSADKGASNNRNDVMVDAEYWVENPGTENEQRWVYTCGFITENDGSSNPHKRLAVYKYDADLTIPLMDPPPPGYGEFTERYLYPPDGEDPWTPTGQHEATDLIVDKDGHVYVCGSSTIEGNGSNGSDNNYVIFKFDQFLAIDNDWKTNANDWGGYNGVWGYDGPEHGNDGAVKMALDNGPDEPPSTDDDFLFVTGTSDGGETNLDILTIKFNASGTLDTTWGDLNAEGEGIVRWNSEFDGDDTAADITVGPMPDNGDSLFPLAVVVGTSYQGTDHLNDIVVLGHGIYGELPVSSGASGLGWTRFVNKDRVGVDTDDDGVAICGQFATTARVFVCGTSLIDDSPTDTDYVVSALECVYGVSVWLTPVWQDVNGKEDDARDIEWIVQANAPQEPITALLVTGQVTSGSNTVCGTFMYNADDDGDLLDSDTYSYTGTGSWGQKLLVYAPRFWIIGGVLSGVADTDVLIRRFSTNARAFTRDLTSPVTGRFPADAGVKFDQGISGALGVTDDDEVFVVGQVTYSATYGPDGLVMGVYEP